ncbi:CheR family methyltransferase [Psychromonas sp. SP041]|uniref:CheR family methyltransferase n=1 Tax=Psychromonas sp. SP041 TaxID=1365007 RepID=UPI00040370E6|nr:CheR family methyltransferase [Psychromonas sp. SP041]
MTQTEKKENLAPSHVVGIGTSAGGLEALQDFFGNLPSDTGATYIVVQHLSPDYKSMMSELLIKFTDMPIFEVTDSITIEANAIYLMPPRKNMLITEGKLLLSEQMPDRLPHLSIDVFLRSLAEDQQHKGIGIVLSGTGTDGTRGIRAMKEAGGLVVIQKPDSAKFDGMPTSAYQTGLADMVLRPSEMGKSLVNFMNHPSIKGDLPVSSFIASDGDNDALAEIFKILKNQSSINFAQYKPSTVSRRIERRLGINQLKTLDAYLRLLNNSPREVSILSKELLINVTRFFRDDEAFDKLTTVAIHKVLTSGNGTDPIRLWIAGCSSGEEAYSIAILFDEAKEKYQIDRRVKIFATDVDEDAIAEASTGVYAAEIVQDISKERIDNYFERTGNAYVVSAKLRKMVIFAQHNMIEDPPFSNINLLSCRNALIYFQHTAQQKVFLSFYFALQQHGFLFLGNSESLGEMAAHFEVVDERTRIFQKASAARLPMKQPSSIKQNIISPMVSTVSSTSGHPSRMVINNKYNTVMERLIEHYAPDSIVLNDSFDAVHVYGDVTRYTKGLGRGKVSINIKDMICNDLAIAVSTALYRSEKNEEDVFYSDVACTFDGVATFIDLAVFMVKQSDHQTSPRSYILQFIIHEEGEMVKKSPKSITFDGGEQSLQRIYDLEQELIKKQEHLQVTVEELETTNEELQSANEELMSSNEELQSTNEELQSVNEELYTVNSEYQEKITQLTEANTDLDNVINSTNIGIIFLDEHLTIRKYTPHSANYINLRTSDIGRPIHHISHELDYSNFLTEIEKVSTKGEIIEQDILTKSGEAALIRMAPYTTNDDMSASQQGVLITITNISQLKFVENALMKAQEQFKTLLLNRSKRLHHRIEMNQHVTVMVVDDDAIDRLRVQRYFKESEDRSYTIVEAKTLEEAIELAGRMKVDVCLLDYQLGANTAEDFVKAMKDKNVDTPIILLSGQNESIMDKEFLSNEIIDVISKDDLSKPLLIRSIDYVLERKEIKDIVQKFEVPKDK